MKKILLIVVALCVSSQTYAQYAEAKVNVAAGALTVFNPSIEVSFQEFSSLTFDYMGAYAREDFANTGYPFIFSMGLVGYRYYPLNKGEYKGLFVSGDFGLHSFRMNKNLVPLILHDHAETGYDVGYGYVIGATVGYKYPLKGRWSLEASVSWGFQHCQHEGYDVNGVRLFELNASAEWTPYKAGLYLNYRLW